MPDAGCVVFVVFNIHGYPHRIAIMLVFECEVYSDVAASVKVPRFPDIMQAIILHAAACLCSSGILVVPP